MHFLTCLCLGIETKYYQLEAIFFSSWGVNEFIFRTEPVQTGLTTRQNSSLMSRDTNVQRGHQSLSHNSEL